MRVPAREKSDRPPCYGKHPSLVDAGCFACVKRSGCFRRFSTAAVSVLPYVQVTSRVTKATDRKATDLLIHGIDGDLWQTFRTVLTKHGLRVRLKKVSSYRAVIFDRDRKVVMMLMRMDPRRVVLDCRMVDGKTALLLGATQPAVSWRSRRTVYRLTFEDKIDVTMSDCLDKLLAASYLAGTYSPGKVRKRK